MVTLVTVNYNSRREKINPVRSMFSTAIKITDRMGEPMMKKKKKRKKPTKRFVTLKPRHAKDVKRDADSDADEADDDQGPILIKLFMPLLMVKAENINLL